MGRPLRWLQSAESRKRFPEIDVEGVREEAPAIIDLQEQPPTTLRR